MSIVAWDGKVLAADKRSVANGCARTSIKAHLIQGPLSFTPWDRKAIIAHCGSLPRGMMLLEWFRSGADPAKWPTLRDPQDWTSLITISHDGACRVFEEEPVAVLIDAPYWAWGSGRDYALGAMAMNADAVRAVEIASQFDVYCGSGIDFYDLQQLT